MILRRIPNSGLFFRPVATVYWPQAYDYACATSWVFERFEQVMWTSNTSCEVMI